MTLNFLLHPDQLGSSEYRAIYELLEDAEDFDEAISICEEFIERAKKLKNILSENQP